MTASRNRGVAGRRRCNEDGAILILALFFAIIVALAVGSLATLAFTSTTSSRAYTNRSTVVDALDSGIQAAVENARVAQGCPTAPPPAVTLTGANAVNGYGIDVTCTGPTGSVTGYSFAAQVKCGSTQPAGTKTLGIDATAALSTIGGGDKIARITSYQIVPSTACAP